VEITIPHVPRCIDDVPQYFVLEALNSINITRTETYMVEIVRSFLIILHSLY
jgi:hypothetical protein